MDRKAIRKVRREIKRLSAQLAKMKGYPPEYHGTWRRLHRLYVSRNLFETDWLTEKARKLGIEVPNDKDGWWEETDLRDQDADGRPVVVLTGNGKAGVRRLIRAERLRTAEQWIKIIIPILALIVAILALPRK